ncbi:TIGR00730 family Rossman fold protein [bacterium]|nr:TIGR00730 family Rossman fold protein [bacterium]
MKRICVFCGSSTGSKNIYAETAQNLGKLLAQNNIGLVYGGGRVGLMGILADSALAASGEVIGVIPKGLFAREVAHAGLTELRFVDSMHQRKAMMEELADGFIALPGGYGTCEEFCEMVTWAQLGVHNKPCGILNVDGFYDSYLSFLDNAVKEGFLGMEHRKLILEDEHSFDLLEKMRNYRPPILSKWIDLDES